MISNLLADVICQTFMKEVGKFQARTASHSSFTLDGFHPEEGWTTRAQFSTGDQAQTYVTLSREGDSFKANSLLAGCVQTNIVLGDAPVNPKPPVQLAMKVVFKTDIDHDKEDGHRYLELFIYGALNYVQVFTRTSWNVIPLDDLSYDDDGDGSVKPGKSYQEGASEWKCVADHDSGWRDGVREVLRDNERNIHVFSGSDWYTVVDAASLGLPEKS